MTDHCTGWLIAHLHSLSFMYSRISFRYTHNRNKNTSNGKMDNGHLQQCFRFDRTLFIWIHLHLQ